MRRAVTFHPSWWHRHAAVSFDRRFHFDPRYRMDADRAMRRALWDRFRAAGLGERDPAPRPVLWTDMLASGFLFSAMMGCEITFGPGAPPQVHCAHLSDEAARSLRAEDAFRSPWWTDLLAQAEALGARCGHVLPCVNLQGVLNIALDLRGEQIFFDMADEPELAGHLFGQIAAVLIEAGRALSRWSPEISAGVTAIVRQVMPAVFLHSNCAVDMISLADYERFLLEHDLALARAFPCYGVHHCGKSMERIAPGYARIPGLALAEVGAGSDVRAVRAALGDGVHLILRYSPARLTDEPDGALTPALSALRADAAPHANASLACVGIDAETPDARVLEFLALAHPL